MTDIAWVDMRGTSGKGKVSRQHRRDAVHADRTACGVEVPRFGRALFASHFEIKAEESTGQCIRCYPYTCRRCRRKRHTGECCSSHHALLCHECYRRSHLVEVCGDRCQQCAVEGLPQVFIHKRSEVLADA